VSVWDRKEAFLIRSRHDGARNTVYLSSVFSHCTQCCRPTCM